MRFITLPYPLIKLSAKHFSSSLVNNINYKVGWGLPWGPSLPPPPFSATSSSSKLFLFTCARICREPRSRTWPRTGGWSQGPPQKGCSSPSACRDDWGLHAEVLREEAGSPCGWMAHSAGSAAGEEAPLGAPLQSPQSQGRGCCSLSLEIGEVRSSRCSQGLQEHNPAETSK